MDQEEETQYRYGVVRRVLEYRTQEVYGVWVAHATFPSDVYFSYNYQRVVPTTQAPPQELYDLLHELSSAMGIWESEDDEDL